MPNWQHIVSRPKETAAIVDTDAEIRMTVEASLAMVQELVGGSLSFDSDAAQHVRAHLAYALARPAWVRIGEARVKAYASSWTTRAGGGPGGPDRLSQWWRQATAVPNTRRPTPMGRASWIDQFSLDCLARAWRPINDEQGVCIELGGHQASGWSTRRVQVATVALLDPAVRGMLRGLAGWKPWWTGSGLDDDAMSSPFWGWWYERRWSRRGGELSHYLGLGALLTAMRSDMRDYIKRLDLEHGTCLARVHRGPVSIDEEAMMLAVPPTATGAFGEMLEEMLPCEVSSLIRAGRLEDARRRLGIERCRALARLVADLDECDRATISPSLLASLRNAE